MKLDLAPLRNLQSLFIIANTGLSASDDAIHRGFDKQTEKDLSRPGNFISNFQCLDGQDAKQQIAKTLTFEKYTEPMRELILASSEKDGEESQFVSSANPRIVDGKPTKNQGTYKPDLICLIQSPFILL